MKNIKKSLFALLACAAVFACTKNEELKPLKTFTGDEAYIMVRLSDASTFLKATEGGFEYGTEEQTVTNAYFYFYDENGVFVSEGSAWNEGTANTDDPAGNIEFESNSSVILKGLTKKNYPKYMVTVLNKYSDFVAPQTLDEMEKTMALGIYDESGNFAMSTTSWLREDGTPYFVTLLQENNFTLEPIEDANSENYVTVYVERLASKVTLTSALESTVSLADGTKLYPILTTVAGEDNTADNVESGAPVAGETIYINLLGWKLNGVASQTYMLKNIDVSWTDGALGFTWNRPEYFRSYWGKSYNYGLSDGTYPANAAEVNPDTDYLMYYNLQDSEEAPLVAVGESAYCTENTNTAAVLNGLANPLSAYTSVLLKANICDAEGNALEMIRFNGVLFTYDRFKEYIIGIMNAKNAWNVYVPNGTDGYIKADAAAVEITELSDGGVSLSIAEGTTVYESDGTQISDLTAINTALADACYGAIGYAGGLMYYNIPIEHLNNTDSDEVPEGRYGVVRNHHYQLKITKLENLGHGIFNPDEVIIPTPGEDKYYVGADIKILSWKIVSQDVEL